MTAISNPKDEGLSVLLADDAINGAFLASCGV